MLSKTEIHARMNLVMSWLNMEKEFLNEFNLYVQLVGDTIEILHNPDKYIYGGIAAWIEYRSNLIVVYHCPWNDVAKCDLSDPAFCDQIKDALITASTNKRYYDYHTM